MSYCYRCATRQLHGATVCRICCAPLDVDHAEELEIAGGESVLTPAMPPPGGAEAVFASWPFGGADIEAAAQVAANAVAARVRAELTHFARRSDSGDEGANNGTYSTAQSTTYSISEGSPELSAMPAQRLAKSQPDTHSVPSVGPNPFLAATHLDDSHEEETMPEAYSA